MYRTANQEESDESDPSALHRGPVCPVGTYFPYNDRRSIHYLLLSFKGTLQIPWCIRAKVANFHTLYIYFVSAVGKLEK